MPARLMHLAKQMCLQIQGSKMLQLQQKAVLQASGCPTAAQATAATGKDRRWSACCTHSPRQGASA